jgi:hypothetical protein
MIRYLLLFSGIAFFSCKQNNNREWLPNDSPTLTQVFSIDANRDTTIIGTSGTVLKIRNNSFQTSTGVTAQGTIEVRLQEFYTKWDFIKNRLSTITIDGKLLQSSGMVFIEALSDTSMLSLKNDHPITIMFPRKVDSRKANLFSGQMGPNDEARWSLLEGIHHDTLIVKKETIEKVRFGVESITVELKFVIGDDTVDLNPENEQDFAKVLSRLRSNRNTFDSVAINSPNYIYDTPEYPYYVFETSSLGLINCDFFLNMEVHELAVQLDNSKSDVFIIIDSLNSVLYPDSIVEKSNNYIFSIPEDLKISIVAYRKDNNKYYLGTERTNSTFSKVTISQTEKPLDNINVEIKRLSENPR